MTATDHDQRIVREERHWNTSRMFALGFGFLGACLAVIFAMAYSSSPSGYSLIPWW
jgi:hypothetical protein